MSLPLCEVTPVPYIKFKKTHTDAILPSSKYPQDTGYDITAVADAYIEAKSSAVVPTGIQVADISPNMWYLVLPRSGMGFKHGIQPHLGVIDQPYRGDLAIKLYNFSENGYAVKKGDRIAQIAFFPLLKPTTSWAEDVTQTDRGSNGGGSSGA